MFEFMDLTDLDKLTRQIEIRTKILIQDVGGYLENILSDL